MGLTGPMLAAGAREPLMPSAQASSRSAVSILLEPLRDPNFFRLVRYLVIFNFALTMAVPFFAVYMLTRLGFSLPTVIGFTILSQVTNVLFVRVWGAMADRTGSKAVLSLASSLYLLNQYQGEMRISGRLTITARTPRHLISPSGPN